MLEVARSIEREWLAHDNDCDQFPGIVYRLTEKLDLSEFGDLSNLPALLQNPYTASLQRPSTFSDLYLKLYDNGRFWIEVLNWWGSDINVHDHNFSGVQFQLKGNSLNVGYHFDAKERMTNLNFGELSVVDAEIWKKVTARLSEPGTIAPHNVSHLDVPTVSLLIRTHPVLAYGHQWNYLAPGVTGNYGVADIIFRKKVGALRLLSKGPRDDFHRTVRKVLQSQTRRKICSLW